MPHGTLGVFDVSSRLTSLERIRARAAALSKPRPTPTRGRGPRLPGPGKATKVDKPDLGSLVDAIEERDRYIADLEAIIREADEDIAALTEGEHPTLADVVRRFLMARTARYPGVTQEIAELLVWMDRLARREGGDQETQDQG